MRTLLINIGFLLLIVTTANGQSIVSIRDNVFTSYTTKNGIPKRIIKTNIFYTKTGKDVTKEDIEFSPNLDTIVEKRYRNSELYAKLVFVFNKNKKLIYSSYDSKIPLIGWQFGVTTYKYNKTGLREIQNFDKQGNLINSATIENDSLKNPVLLKLFNSSHQLLGYEVADYHYRTNQWTDKVYSNLGNLISERKYWIKPEQTFMSSWKNLGQAIKNMNKYNASGDCILYPRSLNDNGNTYYQVSYKYDKYGNWIQKKIYTTKKVGDKFKDKRLNRIFKRKIKYRTN